MAEIPKVLLVGLFGRLLGASRLPGSLKKSGARIIAVCQMDAFLAQTKYVDDLITVPKRGALLWELRYRWALVCALLRQPDFIVPMDEHSLQWMHSLRTRFNLPMKFVFPKLYRVINQSLPPASSCSTALTRAGNQALAERLGLCCPRAACIGTLEELDQFIQRNGLPLVLKAENSTAGTGVRVCDSLEHARAYWTELKERGNGVAILAQRYIVGVPAMYSFVAMNGNILDGIAALKVTCHPGATGPSATIQVIAHEEIQKTAQAMAKALGLSGYASFDYVVEKETQHAYLIECNPRPTPICHLGGLSGSLLEAVTGGPIAKQSLSLGSKIALFPQEWIRRDAEVNDPDLLKDVPADDPELFAHLDAYRLSCLSANRR